MYQKRSRKWVFCIPNRIRRLRLAEVNSTREIDGFQKQILMFSVFNRLEGSEGYGAHVQSHDVLAAFQQQQNFRECQRTIVLIASTIVAPIYNMSFWLESGMDVHYPSHYVHPKTLERITETKPLKVGKHHTLAQWW